MDGKMKILTCERKGITRQSRYEIIASPLLAETNYAHYIQVFGGKLMLWLAYQSIGVIYGDIGTSPLYVYSSTFSSAPSYKDLVGVLSLIIWSVFMMVTVKYIFIILYADNDGEGGTFSTYSLLSRYVRLNAFHLSLGLKLILHFSDEYYQSRSPRGVDGEDE
jgi:K+ potassium transporter